MLKPSQNPAATIVFIHGFPFSSEMWRQQLSELPETIQGIAYDIRGFGNTDPGHSYFTIDLFSRDLLKFLDALSLPKVILCGISMGGYIALRVSQIALDRISGLVLCDTNAVTDTDEGRLRRFSTIEQIIDNGKASFASAFLHNVFHEKTFQDKPLAVKLIEDTILHTSENTICSTLLALASRTDTTEILDKINVPVLVIRGSEDKIMTEEQAIQLVENIPSAELQIIPDSGHLPNLENPETFNFHLNSFLKKHF